MAVSVTGTWTASYTPVIYVTELGVLFGPTPAPDCISLQVPVTSTGSVPGNWLVACVSWRLALAGWSFTVTGTPGTGNYFTLTTTQASQVYQGQQFTDASNPGVTFTVTNLSIPESGTVNVYFMPAASVVMASPDVVTQITTTISVADDVHNWWDPLSAGNTTSSASGVTRSSIWVAPAARVPGNVMIAPTGGYVSLACTIYSVSGIAPWFTAATAVTGVANASTSLTMTAGAPSASSLFFTVSGSDVYADTISLGGGAGWSSVSTVKAENLTNTSGDLVCASAYQVSGSGVTASWTSTGTTDLSGVTAGLLVSAPALSQLSPNWPVTIFECSPGNGILTQPDMVTWTSLTAVAMKMDVTQGRQYEASQLSAGEGTLLLDNPLGALIPPGSGSYAGINSGTPLRMRAAWQGGTWQMQFTGNGTTASPQAESYSNRVPVTPHGTYTASAWLACSTVSASSASLSLAWYNAGGTVLSSITSPGADTTAATLVTVTGTAPATAATADYIIGASGTPPVTSTFYAAAALPVASGGYVPMPAGVTWHAENNATVTTLASWLPDPAGAPNVTPWYVPFSGYLERLPQQWDENLRGRVEATITDAWFGANFSPDPILFQEILDDAPYAYWPCADPAGATSASNFALGHTLSLNVITSKYGAGGATYTFGQNSQAIFGAETTTIVSSALRVTTGGGMWQQATTANSADEGYSLNCVDLNYPSIANGMSIEIWFQVTALTYDSGGTFYGNLWSISEGINGAVCVYLTSTSGAGPYNVNLIYQGSLTVATEDLLSGLTAGSLYQLVIVFTSATSFTYYLNGIISATVSLSGNQVKFPDFTSFTAGGPFTRIPFITGNSFNLGAWEGYTAQVAIFPEALSQSRVSTHYQAGVLAMQGEPAWYRIERLLQCGNLLNRRVILQDQGIQPTYVVSCQDISGQPMSGSISNLTGDLLPGLFYIAPTGDIFYLDKSYAYNQPITWTLGEDIFGGEEPFLNDITFDYDPTKVINEIQLTQLDNQDVVTPSVPAVEIISQDQYGAVSDLATGYLYGDNTVSYAYGPGLQDTANWLACTYAAPHLRLTTAKINAVSNPLLWQFVLGASAGDMVVVHRRSLGAASIVITVTGRISQLQRTFEYSVKGAEASINCIIDPAPEEDALTCDDPVRGLLNGTNVLGW